jgi:ADP-heptose:LPS heptosyltransferase
MTGSQRLPTTMLVDLPNWLGDQMMAMPALHRLVQANRGGETVLHTRPPMLRLLAELFPKTQVIASLRKTSPLSSARTIRGKHGRVHVGISLRNAARAKILIRLSARWSIGSRGEGAFALLSEACGIDRRRHQVHDADAILEALGLEAADPLWRPPLPAVLERECEEVLRGAGMDRGRAVGLAPASARSADKRWPVEKYGELAVRLQRRGYEPVVVIGPGERPLADDLCSAAGRSLPVIGERRDVAGLAAAVSSLRALVGNDSGPMQTAARFGTPVVAIFGPTRPDRTGPLGFENRVLSCRYGLHDRIRGIAVDEVEEALTALIHAGG